MAKKANTTLIQSSDGKTFKVDEDIIEQMKSLRIMFEKLHENVDESQVTAVPVLDSDIMKKAVEWCERHKKQPVPRRDADKKRRFKENEEWEAKFLEENKEIIVELMMAANYLELESLIKATSTVVASKLKGKTAAEMRRFFNVHCDYSAQELKEVKEENDWKLLSFHTE